MFERFERAVPAQHFGGLGLGLYIARQIVEAHGGAIRVESVPGAGATFTVELPREPPARPEPAAHRGPAERLTRAARRRRSAACAPRRQRRRPRLRPRDRPRHPRGARPRDRDVARPPWSRRRSPRRRSPPRRRRSASASTPSSTRRVAAPTRRPRSGASSRASRRCAAPPPTHLDSHKHAHAAPAVLDAVAAVAVEARPPGARHRRGDARGAAGARRPSPPTPSSATRRDGRPGREEALLAALARRRGGRDRAHGPPRLRALARAHLASASSARWSSRALCDAVGPRGARRARRIRLCTTTTCGRSSPRPAARRRRGASSTAGGRLNLAIFRHVWADLAPLPRPRAGDKSPAHLFPTREVRDGRREAGGAEGRCQDHAVGREADRPRPAHHPVHRGRRHRARHLARRRPRPRRGRREGLRRQAQDRLDRGLRRREGVHEVQQLAARRDDRGVPRVPHRHQGPAHDAHRRRHPLAQRRAPPAPRPLRLPAARALVQGRPLAGEEPAEGRHGDLPREHRGHLRRHRVGGRARSRRRRSSPSSRRSSRRTTGRSASRARPASASSRSRARAPSGSSAPPSSTRSA